MSEAKARELLRDIAESCERLMRCIPEDTEFAEEAFDDARRDIRDVRAYLAAVPAPPAEPRGDPVGVVKEEYGVAQPAHKPIQLTPTQEERLRRYLCPSCGKWEGEKHVGPECQLAGELVLPPIGDLNLTEPVAQPATNSGPSSSKLGVDEPVAQQPPPTVAESHARIVSGKGEPSDYVRVLGDPRESVSITTTAPQPEAPTLADDPHCARCDRQYRVEAVDFRLCCCCWKRARQCEISGT